MTHDRSETIPLAADIARCEPAKPCPVRGTCARYQAALPAYHAVVADFSLDGGGALCPEYIMSASVRKAAQPVRRRVHPAPEGL